MSSGTVVLGVGNPLMTDDGLGLAAIAALEAHWEFKPAVEFVDGGTWGMRLLPTIEDAERLLIIDAIDKGAPPGTLVELRRSELPLLFSAKVSPHQVDLREVITLATLKGTLPPVVAAIGLQPARIRMGTSLSPLLEARLNGLVNLAVYTL